MEKSAIQREFEASLEVAESMLDTTNRRRIKVAYEAAFQWLDWRALPKEIQDSFDLDAIWAYMADSETTEKEARWVIRELKDVRKKLRKLK